mmetsp:Transcript_50109/g.73616  ORF Transcript_50109/g.73616 Transcript_50109/m.73616 type:complete len:104 (+) Transcript_50109:416-727(+)
MRSKRETLKNGENKEIRKKQEQRTKMRKTRITQNPVKCGRTKKKVKKKNKTKSRTKPLKQKPFTNWRRGSVRALPFQKCKACKEYASNMHIKTTPACQAVWNG